MKKPGNHGNLFDSRTFISSTTGLLKDGLCDAHLFERLRNISRNFQRQQKYPQGCSSKLKKRCPPLS